MDNQQMEQQVDRFIGNQMSPSERQEFCRRLEVDEELKQQVKLRMLLVEGELIHAEKSARMAMEGSVRHTNTYPWIAAACIAFILVGVGVYMGNSYRYSTQQVYQTYYTQPVIERTRGAVVEDKIAVYNQQIITFYERQQYKAITELYQNEHLAEVTDAFAAHTLLYISIAFIEQHQAQTAIDLLSPLTATSLYKEEAQWLLLCCYLETDERNKALQLAEKIKEQKSIYAETASSIEEQLKEKRWF